VVNHLNRAGVSDGQVVPFVSGALAVASTLWWSHAWPCARASLKQYTNATKIVVTDAKFCGQNAPNSLSAGSWGLCSRPRQRSSQRSPTGIWGRAKEEWKGSVGKVGIKLKEWDVTEHCLGSSVYRPMTTTTFQSTFKWLHYVNVYFICATFTRCEPVLWHLLLISLNASCTSSQQLLQFSRCVIVTVLQVKVLLIRALHLNNNLQWSWMGSSIYGIPSCSLLALLVANMTWKWIIVLYLVSVQPPYF